MYLQELDAIYVLVIQFKTVKLFKFFRSYTMYTIYRYLMFSVENYYVFKNLHILSVLQKVSGNIVTNGHSLVPVFI